jgi:hypothetical protein
VLGTRDVTLSGSHLLTRMCSRDRYLAYLLPFTVQDGDVKSPGSVRHIHRDLSGDDDSLIRGFLIIAAIKAGWNSGSAGDRLM